MPGGSTHNTFASYHSIRNQRSLLYPSSHLTTHYNNFTLPHALNSINRLIPIPLKFKMLSKVFTVLALGAATLVAGAPMEARTADEQVTVSNTQFARKDSNGNDNWDTLLGVSFDLATPSSSIHCAASGPDVPSNKYVCSDPAYSFEISGRPGYDQYAFTIYHNSEYVNPSF
jgi:hypothetical protein